MADALMVAAPRLLLQVPDVIILRVLEEGVDGIHRKVVHKLVDLGDFRPGPCEEPLTHPREEFAHSILKAMVKRLLSRFTDGNANGIAVVGTGRGDGLQLLVKVAELV